MPRIQYLSDLHFEFHADEGVSFVSALDPRGIDVLVLAGDIAVGAALGPALDRLCHRYATASVVFVHGNHELYGHSRPQLQAITASACARNPNLRWLDGDVVDLCGLRFVGAPMWFRHPGPAEVMKWAMNDFARIVDFESWVYQENARALEFLEREVRAGDVVVTHYLPSAVSIAPQFAGDPLNAFFLCDVEPLIRARRPRLWIHGHTHASVDAVVGDTRILCNPFGYAGHELNRAFVADAIVELGSS